MSAQAVGGAVGHNPISIIVPCHRVIGTDKSLTGYAGGIEKKAELLKLEKEGVVDGFKTVSYTHLDVYKRQVPVSIQMQNRVSSWKHFPWQASQILFLSLMSWIRRLQEKEMEILPMFC